jgi:hypothetical protein
MTTMHLFQIETLKQEFNNIVSFQEQITHKKSVLETNLASLKTLYGSLVKENNKKIFLFCLDSFYFQYKTLSFEMDNIVRYISMLNNRIYGDYYKLYHIILTEWPHQDGLKESLMEEFKKFTSYKDLDPFHEYPQEEMKAIHNNILKLLNHLYKQFLEKEQNILQYHDKTRTGMSIGNFMQTLSYENNLMKEQLSLYINYLTFFHKSQQNYLHKLFIRVEQFQKEIEEDILNNQGTAPQTPLLEDMKQQTENRKHEIQENLARLESEESLAKTEVLENKVQETIEISIQEEPLKKETPPNLIVEVEETKNEEKAKKTE